MHVAILHNAVSADAGPDEQDVLVQVDAVRSALLRLTHRVTTVPCTLDLAALVGTEGYVGFSAATGGLNASHDILSWKFAQTSKNPSAETPPPDEEGPPPKRSAGQTLASGQLTEANLLTILHDATRTTPRDVRPRPQGHKAPRLVPVTHAR